MSDSRDFETWARAGAPRLVRFATLLTGSADDGADVVQDVLLVLFRDWNRISRSRNVDAYASRMVVNRHLSTVRSLMRRSRREQLVARPEVDERTALDVRVADQEALASALADLGPRQRAIVLLRHVDDVTDADIAAALHCSTATVRSQASRALAHLHAALSEGSPA